MALLAGCAENPAKPPATTSSYTAPSGGPTARLLVRVNHLGGRYSISTFDQPVGCSLRREFTSATAREPESQAFVLAANKLQTLSFLHVRADRQACEVVLSFEAKAGNTYLMRNIANAEGCRVELFNATNADAPTVERTRIRRERVGMGLNDNACKPLMSTVRPRDAAGSPDSRDAKLDALEPFIQLLPGK